MEYPKIDTIFVRDEETHKVTDKLKRQDVAQISQWLVTEKIDGTNIRVSLVACTGELERQGHENNEDCTGWFVRFGGRTEQAQLPTPLLAHLQDTFTVEKMKAVCVDGLYPFTLFGEGYGAGIQKGGGYRPNPSFRLFDVRTEEKWLNWGSVCDIAGKLGILTVPLLSTMMTLEQIVRAVRDGFTSLVAIIEGDQEFQAEGVVARTEPYLYDWRGRPLRLKLKTKDY